MTDALKVSSSCLRYYTNISSQYIWYTQYINETPLCNIRPVDLSRKNISYARNFTIHHRSGINYHIRMSTPSCTTNTYWQALQYRHWYINECRCRGSMLWPMSPAYYHQMAVNLWVSKNIDRRNYIMYHLQEPLGHYRAYVLRSVWMKYGGNKYISLSGNWDDGSLHAIVNETYRCTMHDALSQKVWYSFTFCTQQSTVGIPYAICMMIYA